ncbi:Endonuclease/exonuclease/phosphatase [Blastocladiella britannica]|nr:Endonuclease/exonuclease/phosphatase [Blastocladiella britannica]
MSHLYYRAIKDLTKTKKQGAYKAGAKIYRGTPTAAILQADYADATIVVVKPLTVSFGPVQVRAVPAIDRSTPVEFVIDMTEPYLAGVPVAAFMPPIRAVAAAAANPSLRAPPKEGINSDDDDSSTLADAAIAAPDTHLIAVPRSIDPPYGLRLLSYNLFLRPLMVASAATFASNDYKESRTDMFCDRVLDRFDVICLQEVFDASLRDTILSAARRHDFGYSLDGPMSSAGVGSGLLLLSRFPILEPNVQAFATMGSGADQLSTKGFLSCKLLLPRGGTVNMVAAHLQATPNAQGVAPPLHSESATVRYSQLVELATALRQRPHLTDAGTLLVGDLNVPGGSAEYARMLTVLQVCTGAGVLEDVFANAGMACATWRPWERVSHPSNLADATLARVLGTTPDSEGDELAADSPRRLDYMLYLRTTTAPAAPAPAPAAAAGDATAVAAVRLTRITEPMFHVELEHFAVEDVEGFDQLSDHSGLCLYMP